MQIVQKKKRFNLLLYQYHHDEKNEFLILQ